MLSMEKCFPLRYYHPLRFESSTLRKQKKDDNQSCRLSLQLIIKVPLTGGGFRGRVTRSTLRKQKKTTTKVVV